VLLADGIGGFRPGVAVPVGKAPSAVAIRDLDGNGILDVTVANGGSRSVTVLLGGGDGSFPNRYSFAVPGAPRSMTIGDFDRNGRPDLAVTLPSETESVAILRNLGGASFAPATTTPAPRCPTSILAAYLNGDPWQDLIVVGSEGRDVGMLPGNGDGTFGTRREWAVGMGPRAAAVGDLNRDGWPDIVTANAASNTISVLLARGFGNFRDRTDITVGVIPRSVAIADLDRDGNLDIGVGNSQGGSVSILLGNGDGTFDRGAEVSTGALSAIALADVNEDGIPDLQVAKYPGVSVMLGFGNGSFGPPAEYWGRTYSCGGLVVGDQDLDGHVDLILGGGGGDYRITLCRGRGDGTFVCDRDFGCYQVHCYFTSVGLGNFSGGSQMEIAGAVWAWERYPIHGGEMNHVFVYPQGLEIETGPGPRGMAAVDLNLDGVTDIAVATSGANAVTVLASRFAHGIAPGMAYGVGVAPQTVTAADLNLDGRPDLVVPNGGSNTVSVLLGVVGVLAAPEPVVRTSVSESLDDGMDGSLHASSFRRREPPCLRPPRAARGDARRWQRPRRGTSRSMGRTHATRRTRRARPLPDSPHRRRRTVRGARDTAPLIH
jgi:hypothetical protein